jgi:hypothetical protein
MKNARTLAKEIIRKASILTVIGYSFPDFNRFLDKEIFSEENLNKIYIQDPDAENIVQKLAGVNRNLEGKAEIQTTTNNFKIPIEFWEN